MARQSEATPARRLSPPRAAAFWSAWPWDAGRAVMNAEVYDSTRIAQFRTVYRYWRDVKLGLPRHLFATCLPGSPVEEPIIGATEWKRGGERCQVALREHLLGLRMYTARALEHVEHLVLARCRRGPQTVRRRDPVASVPGARAAAARPLRGQAMSAAHVIEGRPVEDLIIGATDGTLGAASNAALRTHLLSCPTCTELSSEHARLGQRLATPVESAAAMHESLARVRQAASAKPRPGWARPSSAIALVAGLSAALVVAVLASLAIGESVARLQIPERELVSERSELLGEDRLVLRVEDGRFAATGAQTSGVLISAELTLAGPRTGRAELRFALRGEPYGVLATVPDLAGATKARIENRMPQVEALTVIEIWLHLEDGQETLDSERLTVQIEPSHGGLRARAIGAGH